MSALGKTCSVPVEHPFIVLQELDRPNNSFTDAQLGRPAEFPDSRAIQENERAVTDPTALAAAVPNLRGDAQMLGDPADRIIHLAVLVQAQVKDIDLGVGLFNGSEDRRDAVFDVEVGLALPAIAEHLEIFGMGLELAVEIENVTVRVALSQDGYEAKNVAPHAKAFAIGGNQPFGGHLRRGVERGLDWKWSVLGRRKDSRLSVNRTRGGKRDPLNAIGAHG